MTLPHLDSHLDIAMVFADEDRLRAAVKVLLDANTCFARIGGQLELRFHDRGLAALNDAGMLP